MTLALRVLTLIEYLVRRACQASGQALSGLYEGQPSRQTDTPTGRRLLRAFARAEISLLHIRAGPHSLWQVTPLIPVLVTILSFLGLDESVYTNLELHRA